MTVVAKVYGPVRAAGTRVEELEADKTIESGSYGVTGYLGIMEKGPTDDLISTYSKKDMLRKIGGRIAGSLLPDAAQDFWDHSEGNGELHFVRVTDGTGVQAQLTLYTRRLVAGSAGSQRYPLATIKAHNVGRWGGKRKIQGGVATGGIADFTATTLITGQAMLLNEWKDAELTLDGVAGRVYRVLSNTIAGILTIESDENMIADLGLAPADFGWAVKQANAGKSVAIEVGTDDLDPAGLFYIKTYVDGIAVKAYEHLSIDPLAENYYANVINDDVTALGNFEIKVTNLWTGGVHADIKPGWTGVVNALGGTNKVLTVDPFFTQITSSTGANPTLVLGAFTSAMQYEDTLTLTVLAGALTASVVSARFGTLNVLTFAAAYTPITPYLPPMTITNGATPLAVADVIVIQWTPFVPNALANATLIPRLAAPTFRYNVQSNTINTITTNVDMSPAAPIAGSQFMLIQPMECVGGYDGSAAVADADFIAKLDTVGSYFNKLRGKNKGLVKMAAPGKTTTDVQKAGKAYAEYNAYQWRVEIPSTTTTEDGAITQIDTTIGRSTLGTDVTTFPSFERVTDPDRPTTLKLVPSVGMIHGREAKIAAQFQGYHRAAAGTIADLPRVKAHPVNVPEEGLDEERLNPAGIGVSKKIGASFYVWGDRTTSRNSDWKWKHQREQMCHYINVLREAFPWALFDINDPISDMPILAALTDYFKTEWDKRALDRSFSFDNACQIKMDGSVNTAGTRAAGDKIAEVRLRLANVTERLILRIGKAGIFEAVG